MGAVTRELSIQVGRVAGERVVQVHTVGAVQVGAVHAAVHAGGGHVVRIVPEAGPRSVEGVSLRPVLQAALQGKGWPGQFIREGLRVGHQRGGTVKGGTAGAHVVLGGGQSTQLAVWQRGV